MLKAKTHSGAKKRLRRLKNGQLKGAHTGRRKNLIKKSAKRKQGLRKKFLIGASDIKRFDRALPL